MAKRIDEISGEGLPAPQPPRGPTKPRMHWSPDHAFTPKVNVKPAGSRLVPGSDQLPPLRYLDQQDLDALLDRIKAEEALPAHKKNAARINTLKRQALLLMKQMECLWVQRNADRLLPRLNEDQAG